VCQRGFVPFFYGCIDRIDPSALNPPLEHFLNDKYQPRARIVEYLPNAERLNCVNYSDALFRGAVDGIKAIHNAFVRHGDIYPKNILITPDRAVGDFDVAATFSETGPFEKEYCD
jgi:serine/threonine protein kinase